MMAHLMIVINKQIESMDRSRCYQRHRSFSCVLSQNWNQSWYNRRTPTLRKAGTKSCTPILDVHDGSWGVYRWCLQTSPGAFPINGNPMAMRLWQGFQLWQTNAEQLQTCNSCSDWHHCMIMAQVIRWSKQWKNMETLEQHLQTGHAPPQGPT